MRLTNLDTSTRRMCAVGAGTSLVLALSACGANHASRLATDPADGSPDTSSPAAPVSRDVTLPPPEPKGTNDWAKYHTAAQPAAAMMFADTNNGWRVGPSNGGPYLDSNLAAAPIDAGYRWPTAELWSTDDGGSSWKVELDGAEVDGLWGVDLLSATHGWAVGVTGLLVTDDGGANWSSLPEPAAGNLVDVDFASPETGWGVVTDGSLVMTTDGGDTWQVVGTAPKAISSSCLAKDVGYAVDQSGNLWRQPQGGDFDKTRQASEDAETPVWSVIDCTGSTVTASIEYPSLEGASGGYEVVASDDSGRSWSQVVSTLGKNPGPDNAVVAPPVDLAGTSDNGGVALSLLPDNWGVR